MNCIDRRRCRSQHFHWLELKLIWHLNTFKLYYIIKGLFGVDFYSVGMAASCRLLSHILCNFHHRLRMRIIFCHVQSLLSYWHKKCWKVFFCFRSIARHRHAWKTDAFWENTISAPKTTNLNEIKIFGFFFHFRIMMDTLQFYFNSTCIWVMWQQLHNDFMFSIVLCL